MAKATISKHGLPSTGELKDTQDTFFQTFAWEGFKARLPKLLQRGIGKAGEFELNLGKNVGSL